MNLTIQALRGISVIAVFLYHVDSKLFPNGYLGVNIFFIISGYVMAPKIEEIFHSRIQLRKNLIKFFQKRFYRLAPAFCFIASINLILLFPFTLISEQNRVLKQTLLAYFGFGNLGAYKYANNYFHPNELAVIHYWSLSTELQIYFFVPIVIAFFYIIKNFKFNWWLNPLILARS